MSDDKFDKMRNKLKKMKLSKIKAVFWASALICANKAQAQPLKTVFPDSNTDNKELINSGVKYYFNVQKIDKITDIPLYSDTLSEEERLKQQPFASYHSRHNAVVFIKYEMDNPTEQEQKKLDEVNKLFYSTDVAMHEECHFEDDAFFDEIQDGTTPLLPSDKAEFRMLMEVMAYSKEKEISFEESLDMFSSQLAANYKQKYAQDVSGYIVMALTVDENESGEYSFHTLKENKSDIFNRYIKHRNLTQEQMDKFTGFIKTLDLDAINLSDAELRDLRSGRELETMRGMLKNAYYSEKIPENWVETNRPVSKNTIDFMSAEAMFLRDTTQRR